METKKQNKIDYCIPSEDYRCRDFKYHIETGVIEKTEKWGWMMYETKIDYCPWCGRDLED